MVKTGTIQVTTLTVASLTSDNILRTLYDHVEQSIVQQDQNVQTQELFQ